MMLSARTPLLLTLLSMAGACGTAASGGQYESRYRHPAYPYLFESSMNSPSEMMGPEWRAASLMLAPYPGTHYAGYATQPASHGPGGGGVAQSYDWNADGESDYTEEIDKYDIALEHPSGASVFIRAVPVPRSMASATLEELAAAYVDAARAGGSITASFSPKDLPQGGGTKFDLAELDAGSCQISAVDAYRIELKGHVASDRPLPEERARLIVVRPGYKHRVEINESRFEDVEVMLVAAYTNSPRDFDEFEDDFDRFLGHWVLGGYGEAIAIERMAHTCRPPGNN